MLSTMDSSASNVCIKQNVWRILKCQAEDILRREPALRPLVHEAILKHASFGDALIYRLAQKLGDKILTVDFFLSIFREVIRSGADIERYAMEDLIAVEQRDPACRSIAQAFLYFKGYQSIQAYRLSRFFWLQNRKV
jgi:serine O-acetyltransferase